MIKCQLPRSNDIIGQISESIRIINEMENSTESPLIIDMSDLNWISPLSALLLSNKIKEINTKVKISIKVPSNKFVRSYLTAIGFPMGGSGLGFTYCPIHHVKKDIHKEGDNILKIIDRHFPETIRGNIAAYLVSEFCDNIEEHSKFSQASVMAQFYGSTNSVEMGFFDNGITIPGRFKANNIRFGEDHIAINMALDGISTKIGESRGEGINKFWKASMQRIKWRIMDCIPHRCCVH